MVGISAFPKKSLQFDENNWEISIIGSSDGSLNINTSVNQALGFRTSQGLFNKLETLENKMWYKDDGLADSKKGTLSRVAALDFFKEAGNAYGLRPDIISYSNIAYEADKNKDGQLNITEFRNAASTVERELRKATSRPIDVFNFK